MTSLRATVGANVMPYDPAELGGEAAFVVSNRGRDSLLKLLSVVIPAEVGALYSATVGGAVIATVIPFDPVPLLPALKVSFPALSVHSVGGTERQVTQDAAAKESTYTIRYTLPLLSPTQRIMSNGLLDAVSDAIRAAIRAGGHPDYFGGFPALVGEQSEAKFLSVAVIGEEQGSLLLPDTKLPTLELRLRTLETIGEDPDVVQEMAPLERLDIALDLDSLEDFAEGQVENVPA